MVLAPFAASRTGMPEHGGSEEGPPLGGPPAPRLPSPSTEG